MAIKIVHHSNSTSFFLIEKFGEFKSGKMKTIKQGIAQPDNMNMDFLMQHNHIVKRIIKSEKMPLSDITRDNVYPVINKEKGAKVASRFINGLCCLGFGEITGDKKRNFKRYNPEDKDCPDKENLKHKWRKLNLN